MKNYPLWLPGAGFRRKLEEVRVLVRRMMDVPYEMVKGRYVSSLNSYVLLLFHLHLPFSTLRLSLFATLTLTLAQQAAGTATPSLTATLLEDHLASRNHDVSRLTAEEEEDIKGVAAVLYAGASFLEYPPHLLVGEGDVRSWLTDLID